MPFNQTESAPGEWFTFGKDGDKVIRFRVRLIPPQKAFEIDRRNHGKKGSVHGRRNSQEHWVQIDRDVQKASTVDKAVYALVESENCAVILDDSAAKAYSEALGRTVEPEKVLTLDGQWGRQNESHRYPVKELFLEAWLNVADWIVEKAGKLGIQAQEEEEEGKETSSTS